MSVANDAFVAPIDCAIGIVAAPEDVEGIGFGV